MSLPLGLTRRTKVQSVLLAARLLVAMSVGASAWILVAALAIIGFSQQVTWRQFEIVQKETLCFAYAFVVAGTITGVVASATSGQWRWAMGSCAISIILSALSIPIIRWLIFRATTPDIPWGRRVWDSAVDCMRFGSILGVVFGLIMSSLVLAAVIVERRTKAWQFGLLVAVSVALMGMWALPAVISTLSDMVVLYVGANYRYLFDESLRGAGTGAGTGSLAGAVVAGLTARWYGATERGMSPIGWLQQPGVRP